MATKIDELLEKQTIERLRRDNPWWMKGCIPSDFAGMPRRSYLPDFYRLVTETSVRRAVILMGPRRVGKTVMIYHVIQNLINDGVDPRKIIYVSVDTPIYNNISLEDFLHRALRALKATDEPDGYYVFYDEIQYLKNWEQHLKSMVDTYRNCRFIASGSAAAALKMKSLESGAGRFSDFMLPPLTFHEYLQFLNLENLILPPTESRPYYDAIDMGELNKRFIEYINFGGYPEVVLSEVVRQDPGRYIRNDIIDKVLLRDLPSLYGISDIQELNKLFVHVAFRSGNEFSFEGLSSEAGIKKETLKKYLEYLEAAFLIKVVNRLDQNARRMQRVTTFKVYLTNPSLRAALFSPVTASDDFMGAMVETAIYSQCFEGGISDMFYAGWSKGSNKGEVDMVRINPATQKVISAVEIKWTDRFAKDPKALKSLYKFLSQNPEVKDIVVTTETIMEKFDSPYGEINFVPSALYAYEASLPCRQKT